MGFLEIDLKNVDICPNQTPLMPISSSILSTCSQLTPTVDSFLRYLFDRLGVQEIFNPNRNHLRRACNTLRESHVKLTILCLTARVLDDYLRKRGSEIAGSDERRIPPSILLSGVCCASTEYQVVRNPRDKIRVVLIQEHQIASNLVLLENKNPY